MSAIKARYSPIGHINVMHQLCNEELLDGYILLLAHHVVAFPEEHKQFLELLRSGVMRVATRDVTVILDNSLIELGNAVDLDLMRKAVEITKPTYVVLPDVLLDRQATEIAFVKAYEEWKELLDYAPNTSYLAVVQGAGLDEMLLCGKTYYDYNLANGELIGAFGVPRKFASQYGSRYEVTDKLIRFFRKPIHLMGFSSHLVDDLKTASISGVMGIDSATPLRLGFENRKVSLEFGEKLESQVITPRETFFTEARDLNTEMRYNVAYIKGAIDGLQQR